jgi:hypothetical protein
LHTGLAWCSNDLVEGLGRAREAGRWEVVVARWKDEVAMPFWSALGDRASSDGLRINPFVTRDLHLYTEGGRDNARAWVELVGRDGRSYGPHVNHWAGFCYFGSDGLATMRADWGELLEPVRLSNPYDFEFERREAERELVNIELGDSRGREVRHRNPKALFAIRLLLERDRQAELEYDRSKDHPVPGAG